MGAKGWKEIDKMIPRARVGIVNPSHYMRDETFCMSAIELEAHEIPIVSRQRQDGLNTTIIHGETGYLEKKDVDIAKRIVELLHSKKRSIEMGQMARCYVHRFTPENEICKWKEIVDSSRYIECQIASRGRSKDARLLRYDFFLKVGFLIESGKVIKLFWEKFRRK